jgi:ABC-type uncharacterized transport system permease subunit
MFILNTPDINHILLILKQGLVSQWSAVRDMSNHISLQKLRAFKVSDYAITDIDGEQRRKERS